MAKRYSEDFKNKVTTYADEHDELTYKMVAEKFGVSATTIARWMDEYYDRQYYEEYLAQFGDDDEDDEYLESPYDVIPFKKEMPSPKQREIESKLLTEIRDRSVQLEIIRLVGYDEVPELEESLSKINYALSAGFELQDILHALNISRIVYLSWLSEVDKSSQI